MKALPLACSVALLLMSASASATILTVHNDALYSAQYTSVNTAAAAASDHDTLLIHGSGVSYGNVTISKPLTLIGPGHDPANGPAAFIQNLAIAIGSDSSKFEGLSIGTSSMSSTNNVVERNRFASYLILYAGANDALIIGNTFINAYLNISASCANVEVRNNFFSETSTGYQFTDGSATTLVHFNTFTRSSTSTSSSNRIFNPSTSFTVFADNIFYTATINSLNTASNPNFSFQSNLSYCTEGAVPSLGPNNLDNVTPTWDLGGAYPTFSYTHDYNMLSGTPLTGASDGGQVGAMGGPYPFVNAGVPRNIPRVTSTQLLTPYVPVDGSIDVNFQAVQGQP